MPMKYQIRLLVTGSFTGTNGYFRNLSAGNLIYTMSGTNVVAEQITGASGYINSMTGVNLSEQNITGSNLYENLITSTSITGGIREHK